jgi:hypothetical protein
VAGVVQRITIFIVVVLGWGFTAFAEDLVMPYACTAERGEPRLTAANDTKYRVTGRRDEQPFSFCAAGQGGRCETLMVHRFAIECDGVRIPWARIATAANGLGVALPADLPLGYAPVSALSGRFVFPALTRSFNHVARVAMQDLSPDSVIESNNADAEAPGQAWITTVRADLLPASGGGALRVAGAVVALMAMLLAASMIAAGRWRLPAFAEASFSGAARDVTVRLIAHVSQMIVQTKARAERQYHNWQWSAGSFNDDGIINAFAMVHARLAETELLVATLPSDLLLRDVLQSEIERVRERAVDADRNVRRRPSERSAATVRVLLRELERIGRMAHGAAQGQGREAREDRDAPRSIGEAYNVLGLNADVAPAVAKKLVDALRMSWHPDHARDEPDRLRREGRMKQINAAWDMIKERRVAA